MPRKSTPQNGSKTVGEFPNKATQFTSENQPEGRGRPKGAISLSTRIQRILEGDEKLPAAIQEAVTKLTGDSKRPVDAMIMAGILNALKGDKSWAEWLSNNGYGKPRERHEHTGEEGGPIKMTITWEGE